MEFLDGAAPQYDLTYADAFLVPRFADVSSRMDVDLTTPDGIGTTIPIVVSNMTAVAGRRMAETVARRGGLAIFPQDIKLGAIADMTGSVKNADRIIETAITLFPHDTISTALDLIHKRSHRAVIIIDEDRKPVGVFTETDAEGMDRFAPVSDVMSDSPIAVADDLGPEAMFEALNQSRLHFAPVIDARGRLRGVVTEKGALRSALYTPAVDSSGKLLVGAAIGINGDVEAKTRELIEAGVDVLVVDTAHGHQQKMIEALKNRQVGDVGSPCRRRQCGDPPGNRGSDRRRCRCRQGRRRAGGDVHHPDDDRGRAPPVLGRCRMCGCCEGSGQADLGGRGSEASP